MSRALVLACMVMVSSPLPATDKTHKGEEILEQARSKSDIQELPSFTMRAAIKIEVQGKTLTGEYTFLWNGPNQWREETSLPGFDEIRVGGPGTVALKRNLDFVPLRISQLRYVLGYARGADAPLWRGNKARPESQREWRSGYVCGNWRQAVSKRDLR
jgi:hypothetical protein